jgi:hypothetical protein
MDSVAADSVACPGCGYVVTLLVVQGARFNYPCPRCGRYGLRSFVAVATVVRAWIGPGGALMVDREVPGLTGPRLDESAAAHYGGQWMVAESLSASAAERIAAALGWLFCGQGVY